jgi:hypothetical protein
MDNEILAVENRIHEREVKVKLLAGMAGRRAVKALSSPVSLIGVAALGFVIGGAGRQRHAKQHSEAAATATKAVGFSGLLMTAAMWFIKARFGTPWAAAQWALEKIQNRDSHGRPAATPRQKGVGAFHP